MSNNTEINHSFFYKRGVSCPFKIICRIPSIQSLRLASSLISFTPQLNIFAKNRSLRLKAVDSLKILTSQLVQYAIKRCGNP